MSKIFISHSSKDNDFVKMLAHNLLINGIPICNEDRTTLMTNFKDYLVGLR